MKHYAQIKINGLELQVNLGWPSGERKKPQIVKLDVCIDFPAPPSGCVTDQLTDTYCYDALITIIKNNIAEQHFRLLERLGQEIHRVIKANLPADFLVHIQLTKKPPILNLTGGVTFCFGDIN